MAVMAYFDARGSYDRYKQQYQKDRDEILSSTYNSSGTCGLCGQLQQLYRGSEALGPNDYDKAVRSLWDNYSRAMPSDGWARDVVFAATWTRLASGGHFLNSAAVGAGRDALTFADRTAIKSAVMIRAEDFIATLFIHEELHAIWGPAGDSQDHCRRFYGGAAAFTGHQIPCGR